MGNLSEHYNHKDFACRCGDCKGDIKVHLGLVGALEQIGYQYKRTPRIVEAYRCEIYGDKHNMLKKNAHRMGKAAHIYVEGVPLPELYKFVCTIPEIRGIGVYPKENFLHIDTRTLDKEELREEWYHEGEKNLPLTAEAKAKFNLT